MGFTKLDEGILKSSIMGESAEVFKVWIAFLASCGPDGIARVTAIFLSGVCHFSLPIVRAAIERLEAPDLDSRTEKEEGRRIIKVEGGWFVVNYKKYREFTYSDSPEAIRKREYRDGTRKRPLGYVYFAQSGGRIKIGFSNNPWARISEFKISNPDITLLGAFPGTIEDERKLQEKFRDLLFLGEWYKADPRIFDEIKARKEERDVVGHLGRSCDISASASASASASTSEVREVVSYLNEKTGHNFSPKSSDTIKHISARIAEGRTLEDFKHVIDIKVAKWKGKTWKDTRTGEMVNGDDYLRPSTLFRPGNFENYLNEMAAPAKAKKKILIIESDGTTTEKEIEP